MSKIISTQELDFRKKSWINDLMNDRVLNANLTEEYANDVLESVADETFGNLDEAIADLSRRTGLTASEAGVIKTAAVALVKASTEVIPEARVVCEKKEEEIPGNVPAAGKRLVKESPVASAAGKITVAKGMNPGFQAYLDKKKEEREGKKSKEEGTDKTEDKKEKASLKQRLHKAWFQGSDKPSSKEDGGTNDPSKMGYPAELKYDHAEMATTAPGGQDSRPYEQKAFEGSAAETKKVMGPQGEEFKLKVEMQRIPEGEKPANTARLKAIKKIVAQYKK